MHDHRRRRRRRLALLVLLVLLAVWLHRCGRPALVVGTFNIRQFKAETAAVADAIAALDADVFAVQEILDPKAFDRVLARASEATGRTYRAKFGVKKDRAGHTGVVYDASRLTLERHEAFSHKHAPRGLTATLRGPDDRRLTLLAVHLKAGSKPGDLETRQREWAWLTHEIRRLRAGDDAPVLLAGDLNTTDWLDPAGPERRRLDGLLDDLDARLPTGALACSAYWQPKDRYEPSLLDHVLVPEDMSSSTPEVLGMCAALACAPHDDPHPDFDAVSDHCPVRVRVR